MWTWTWTTPRSWREWTGSRGRGAGTSTEGRQTRTRSGASESDRKLLAEYDRRREARPWRFYRHIPALAPFHASDSPIRLLAGPNRGGKTTAGAFELVSYATGYNHIRSERYPVPNLTWAVALDYGNLGHVLREKLNSYLPPGTRYFRQEAIFKLPKPWNSEIHVKSADSGREKFQGAGIQAAWFDEEPKGQAGEEIFGEVYARRAPGVPLRIFLTFTPLQGLSWSYRKMWNKNSEELLPGVETFQFSLYDCSKAHGGFLTDEEIETIHAGYTEYEREARVYGKYTTIGGSPYFSPKLLSACLEKVGANKGEKYEIRLGAQGQPVLEPKADGNLTVYRPATDGHEYIVGVDAAGGAGRDASVASVWDRDDLALVARWYSNKVDPDAFGSNAVLPLGKHYRNALVVVESNGEHGGTVLAQLRGRYHNTYRNRKWNSITRKYTDEYGWRTTAVSRMRIWDSLARALREDEWTPDEGLIEEMRTVIIKECEKVEHMDGCHDDQAFASGIALAIHYDSLRHQLQPWSHYRTEIVSPSPEVAWMGH